MKPLIFLEYSFLFEPGVNTWSYLNDFERDLGDFFTAHGLEAQIVKTIEGQSGGRRILSIVKLEEAVKGAEPALPQSSQVKQGGK